MLYAPVRRSQMMVTACSACAAQHGIAPGMLLAEAKALAAGSREPIAFELHDPAADRKALEKLAEATLHFSPWVALEEAEEPASLLLDISGCTYGFRDEEELAASAADYFHQHGYQARIAVADTIGAAWAAAHEGGGQKSEVRNQKSEISEHEGASISVPNSPFSVSRFVFSGGITIIPPGQHAFTLHSLDVAALRLPERAVRLLYQFDICRIGQLLALPRESLPSRFGPEVGLRLDQALGTVAELLTPIQVAEPVETCWPLDPPVADRRMIETVFEHLLGRILEQVRPLGIQRLLGSLRMTAGDPLKVCVGLLQPSVSAKHLLELLHLHLERVQTEAEVSEVSLRAEIIRPLEFHQEQLFHDAGAERRRHFPALIERLSSRLGEKTVLRARLHPDAQPEFAFRCSSWIREALRTRFAAALTPEMLVFRPLCMQPRPAPIAVTSIMPEGPPLRFEWRSDHHVVAHSWGPERIETGWWRGQDIARDYYLVETTTGKRFWIFRRRDDEAWFLHGS